MQVRFSATNIEQVGVRYRYLQTFFVISFELRPSALFRNFLPFSRVILSLVLFRVSARNPLMDASLRSA
jgi:hypothetical protein